MKRTAPLIRQRADGTWERLVIGSLAQSLPTYEPYDWSETAWEDKQRRSALARLLGLPGAIREAA